MFPRRAPQTYEKEFPGGVAVALRSFLVVGDVSRDRKTLISTSGAGGARWLEPALGTLGVMCELAQWGHEHELETRMVMS